MTAPALARPTTRAMQSAESLCFSIVGTRGIRVTLVDGCGKPVYGPNSVAVTSGIVSVEFEPETEDGTEYNQKNAAGQNCFPPFTGPSYIKWWNVTITFCNFDPALLTIIGRAWKQVRDYTRSKITGWRMGSTISTAEGFALETWPKSSGAGIGQLCDEEGNEVETTDPGAYFLLPWVVPAAPNSFTLQDEPATFAFAAKTKPGSLWKRGPYNVVMNAPDTPDGQPKPGPLIDPIDPGFKLKPADDPNGITGDDPTHFHGELTLVSPPDLSQCGRHPLWNPSATQATITVTAPDDGDTTKAKLTVENFSAVGEGGTVYWGDGTSQNVPKESGGTVTKTDPYPADLLGTEVTVEFQAANNSVPAEATYIPQQPEVTSITLSPATASITAGENQPYTVAGDPGGQDVTSDTTLTVSPSDAGVTVNGQTIETTTSATAQDYTVTGTYTNSSGTDVTGTATLTVTAAAQAQTSKRSR